MQPPHSPANVQPRRTSRLNARKSPVVAIANRLPIRQGESGWELSPGGLATALRPVMQTHSGSWVGWDGGDRGMPPSLPELETRLLPISLSAAQVRQYYHGFSNATLWPLLHDAIEKPRFERSWWRSYQDVNAMFAGVAMGALSERQDAIAWVHDYHLTLVPRLIRERRRDQAIGYFLHIPWPAPEIFARVPWRQDVLLGMLGADVVSFHAERYRDNFVRACARLLADAGVEIRGSAVVLPDQRHVTTTTAPISIDTAEFTRLAADPTTVREMEGLTEQFAGRVLLLGVDRLDYTKGIIERLLAVEALLERRQDLRTKIAFLQVAVPSRDNVAEYRSLRSTVEGHIGRINGKFTEPGSDVPVHYLHRSLPPEQLAAYYAVADIMLVTPLIDGMNLVAKEYVTVQQARRGSGAMILSEFAGAGSELREAIPCNPFDVEGLSLRIEHALELSQNTRRAAIAAMAKHVAANDVHRWVAKQLGDIAAASRPGGRRRLDRQLVAAGSDHHAPADGVRAGARPARVRGGTRS
ncbi:MAG: trehalose-6-phosphate synthase [Nocardiopsaceae bacterium]|jgi:trehalose 6-phosphate synthase|nr:trehalose-6-phosphate synthase [Nocardiopsaceae bacterium]